MSELRWMAETTNGEEGRSGNGRRWLCCLGRNNGNADTSGGQPTTSSERRREENGNGDEEMELKYGAEHVIRLFVPVSLCMAAVVLTMNTVDFYSESSGGASLLYTPFNPNQSAGTGTQILASFANALIMLSFIIVMTVVLIILYKFRFYRIIQGWLLLSSVMLLTIFTSLYVKEVLRAYNACVSAPTIIFVLFNFAVLGMMAIHWKCPLMLQQAYLISVSALMALTFIKYLPDWTAWTVLGLISVWDLVAVLAPKGPLKMLVQLAQERNEPIFPALIYSSGILYPYVLMSVTVESEESGETDKKKTTTRGEPTENPAGPLSTSVLIPSQNSGTRRPQVRRVPPASRDTAGPSRNDGVEESSRRSEVVQVEEKGIKLGLGDFIFYSVLVGKASSSYDWNTTVACYIAILVGLSCTLLLLAVFRKALPALPISIFAGLIFYFCTRAFVSPYSAALFRHQLTY